MSSSRKGGFFGALIFSWALVLSSCATSQTTQTSTRSDQQRTRTDERQRSDRAGATQTRDGQSSVTFYYPSGSESGSLVKLTVSAPAESRVGEGFDYRVTAENVSDVTLTDVIVTSFASTGFTPTRGEMQGERTTRTDTRRARENAERRPEDNRAWLADAESTRWRVGTLQPDETKTFSVRGEAAYEGNLEQCFTVDYKPLICIATNVTRPELEIEKRLSAEGGEVLACDIVEYTVTVRNTGTGTVRNLVLTDELPQGLSTERGERTARFELASLGAGESKEYTVRARADEIGSFDNKMIGRAEGLEAESPTVNVRVVKPVLEVSKTAPEVEYVGVPLRYRIAVRNTGDGPARDAKLVDTLPNGVRVLNAGDGNVSGRTVTWNLGTLEAGQEREVILVVRASEKGTLTNRVCATAYCAEEVCDTIETETVGIAAILLECIDVEDPVRVGNETTYIIRVTNQGSKVDTNIRIRGTLPDNMSYVRSEGPTTANVNGRVVEFAALPTLEPNAQATWQITARGDSPGDVRFHVQMHTDSVQATPVEETEATNVYAEAEGEVTTDNRTAPNRNTAPNRTPAATPTPAGTVEDEDME